MRFLPIALVKLTFPSYVDVIFCRVSFTIKAKKEKIDEFESEAGGLYKKFKLIGSLSTSNLVVFHEGKLTKFENAEDILRAFYKIRYEFYVKRKAMLVENLREEQRKLSNKARFVEEVCSGDLIVNNRKRADILAELQQRGYELFNKTETAATEESEEEEQEYENLSVAELAKGYEYLLGMKIWSLTFEKAEALRAELGSKTAELETLLATAPSDIWLNDLIAIEEALDARDTALSLMANEEKRAQAKSKKNRAKAAKKTSKKKKSDEWDSDMESDEDDVVELSESSDDETSAVKHKAASMKPKPTRVTAKKGARMNPKIETAGSMEIDDVIKIDSELNKGKKTEGEIVVGPKAALKRGAKRPSDASDSKSSVGVESKASFEVESNVGADDESDDFMMLDLAERMKRMKNKSGNDSSSPKSMSEESSSFESLTSNSLKKAAPTKKAGASKKTSAATKKTSSTGKQATKKTSVKKTSGKKKETIEVLDSDESEDDFEFNSDEDETVAAPDVSTAPPPRSRRARTTAAKKTTYVFSDDEGDSDSDF